MVKRSKATCNNSWFGRQALDSGCKFLLEMVYVMTTDIGEFDMFEIVPDTFIWIQVGCIRREAFQPDAFGSTSGQKALDCPTAMNGCAVPDDEQLALDHIQQLLQKSDDGDAVVCLRLHRQIEFARQCYGAYHRVMVAGEF